MKKDINYLRELIQTHLQSEHFGDAGTELFSFIQDKANEQDILSLLEEAYNQNPDGGDYDPERWSEVFIRIENQIDHPNTNIKIKNTNYTTTKPKTLKLRLTLTIAATMLAVSIIGIVVYNLNKPQDLTSEIKAAQIKPGKNAATLTLANGKKIYLDEHGIGELAHEPGVRITKNQNGELIYTITNTQASDNTKYNTLSTAKGETATVILPDGTKVWLNAASSITYPSSFASAPRREVSLIGEAYFEVLRNAAQPFLVESKEQQVEVIGTHFDISAYPEDAELKTTLLQGRVKVSAAGEQLFLSPGEQAIHSGQLLQAKTVNTQATVDWKDGLFTFDHESMESMMKKIGRWYNVKIEYADPALKKEQYYASFSRFDELSKVLKTIARSGKVTFSVKGNTVTVNQAEN